MNNVEGNNTNQMSGLPDSSAEKSLLERIGNAKKVIKDCRKENCFYASTQNYREPWLRDLVYSEDLLLKIGYEKEVRNHLSEFIKLQRKNGHIPTVISKNYNKLIKRRFQSCISDTEILFVTGMCKYANFCGTEFFKENEAAVNSCIGFIEDKLNKHGLIPGMDWRDAMANYGGKFLLANQMLLTDMYDLLGKPATAESIKEKVNSFFLSENLCCYADSIQWGNDKLKQDHHFDCFGNALAILNNTASTEVSKNILKGFEVAKTPFGYKNIVPHYELNRAKLLTSWNNICLIFNGALQRNRAGIYQNSAIWPFVELRVAAALKKLGAINEVKAALKLILEREGFNEFYYPTTGTPGGSKGQLWTAAAVLSAVDLPQSAALTTQRDISLSLTN